MKTGLTLAGAAAALLLALGGPLGRLADASFAAHMVQHMMLIGVAAPLFTLALGAPWRVHPAAAFAAHAAAIWSAHLPAVVAWMAAYHAVHVAEHVALLGTAILFWWSLRQRTPGEAALWTLFTLIHTGFLGALLTFAPRPLYAGIGIEEQQLAGLIMWVPGGLVYIAAGLAFAHHAFSDAPHRGHPVRS
jgi:cytochrome c oxidase assembly factor CtaG